MIAALALGLLVAAGDPVDTIHAEARTMQAQVTTPLARAFLDAVQALPAVDPRFVYVDRAAGTAYTSDERDALDEDAASGLEERLLDEEFYYTTRYGTPVAYARALEVTAQLVPLDLDGAGVMDFGYGGIGHLRAMASLGARVTGVEVDPVLRALYHGDTGPVPRAASAGDGEPGRLTLVHGHFPGDAPVRAAVEAERPAGGYRLVLSKNVLKRGYIHPAREVDPRAVVDLGVDDRRFIHAVHDLLAPGGLFVIYNLTPKPNGPGVEYRTWADGRCPFEASELEAAGFGILAYDRDDTAAARAMARALGWAEQMDVDGDLFAQYTILRKVSGD